MSTQVKKIILLNHEPISDFIINRFDINHLLKNGFDVEYWDMSRLYRVTNSTRTDVFCSFDVAIRSKKEVKLRVEKNSNDSVVYIKMMHFKWSDLWLHKILSENNCISVFFVTGTVPIYECRNLHVKISRKIFNIDYKKYFLNRVANIIWRIKNLNHYTVVFSVGNTLVHSGKIRSKCVVRTNHYDYDQYIISCRKEVNLINDKYIVFLDENRIDHPDNKLVGLENLNRKKYFDRMNNFFDRIENAWGFKVIIAEHPSSNYSDNTFNNRKRYKYKTSDLVKNCEYVLAHWSTSIDYAVLYCKPLLLLYSNEIKDRDKTFCSIMGYNKELGSALYNIDEDKKVARPFVNSGKYDHFKYNYLVSQEKENKLSTDIFIDFLLNKY